VTNNLIGRRSETTGIIEPKTDLDNRQLRDVPLLHARPWHAASADNGGNFTHVRHGKTLAKCHPYLLAGIHGFETRHRQCCSGPGGSRLLAKLYQNDLVKEGEIDRACSMHGGEVDTKFL
jgi:hypothetical protein